MGNRSAIKMTNGQVKIKTIDRYVGEDIVGASISMFGERIRVRRASFTNAEVRVERSGIFVYLNGNRMSYSATHLETEQKIGIYLAVQEKIDKDEIVMEVF